MVDVLGEVPSKLSVEKLDLGSGVYIEWNISVVSGSVHGHRCHFFQLVGEGVTKIVGLECWCQIC